LDNLSTMQIKRFRNEILAFAAKRIPDYSSGVREAKDLGDELRPKLEEVLKDYAKEAMAGAA